MSQEQPQEEKHNTPSEADFLKEVDRKFTEYYAQEEDIPPADGNEHEEGLNFRRIIEEKRKKD